MRDLPALPALEAFVAVARLGSLKAAAESASVSASALSRRIQAVEDFVGQPLFNRDYLSLNLNAEGERLLAELGPLLDAVGTVMASAKATSAPKRLRIAVPSLFASQRLMKMLPSLMAIQPTLQLNIRTGANDTGALGAGLDAAVAFAKEIAPNLYSRRFRRERLLAIGSREGQQGLKRLTHPTQLRETAVYLDPEVPDAFSHWREAIGMPDLQPAAVNYVDASGLILDAVAQGLGIAVVPESVLLNANDERLVTLFDYEVVSPYSYWFACEHAALARSEVQIFHDWLFGWADIG